MLIWLARRIGISLVLIWLVATLIFSAIHLVPGDPAEALLSQGGSAPDPQAVEALREQLGLNRPILTQYVTTMGALLRGDLGESLQDQSSVSYEIGRRLPRTLELIGAGAVLALLGGVLGGTRAALRPGGWLDRVASVLSAQAMAIPVFVSGPIIVLVFAQYLGWLPAGGYVSFQQNPLQHVMLLIGPTVTLSLGLMATMFQITRASVLDVVGREFVRTARGKGLAPQRIIIHHVIRNALVPVITVLALSLGSLLGGTVLVEYVFNWPGVSSLLIDSVSARDYPEVVGVVLIISGLFVALNLLVDILYAVLDPRVRLG